MESKINFVHQRARGAHPGYPSRFNVPDDKVSWNTEYNYKPVEYTRKLILLSLKDNNDPAKIKDLDKRLSYEQSPLKMDGFGRPLNPYGRTGMSGRGNLRYWGPNQAADAIVTKYIKEKNQLYMVAIKRRDTGEWAIPGGKVEPSENVIDTLKREFEEEAGNVEKSEKKEFQKIINELFSIKNGNLIYQGYVDDPRNTDNAWMESTVYNFHCSPEIADLLTLKAGDDASHVEWILIDDSLKNLYASHKMFVDKTIVNLKKLLAY